MSRTPSLPRRAAAAIVGVAMVAALAACGDDGTSSPAAVATDPAGSTPPGGTTTVPAGGPNETTAPAPAPAGDECYGAFSAAVAGEIAAQATDPIWPVIEPSQDTSRGIVVCYQQFYGAPDAGLGDTDAYLGVTLSDSSRYVDGIGEAVTLDTYKEFAIGAMPMTFGDDSLAWGAGDDTDYRHYRYVAFVKGDLVVMVYAGFEPYAAGSDWSTADALLEQWATELAGRIAGSGLVAADLPAQEVVVAVTTVAPKP